MISFLGSPASSSPVRVPCVVVLSVALLVSQFGCTVRTSHTVTDAEIGNDPAHAFGEYDQVKAVVLKTGERIEFEKSGGFYSPNARAIVGTTVKGEKVQIDVSDIESVEVARVSKGLSDLGEFVTVMVVVGGIALVAGMIHVGVGMANDP